jgi:hypothetical protein
VSSVVGRNSSEVSRLDVVGRSFSERVQLNRQILDNPYWSWAVDSKGHENFMPVGRGLKTSSHCGRWQHFWVCKNVQAHNGVVFKGLTYTGKFAVTHQHMWCHKSSCPVCFIRGWSVREAQSMSARLGVGVERGFGDIEHLTVSPPLEDHGLPEALLRANCRSALLVRGVLGGDMIFHGYRMNKFLHVLKWSPHYHVLGFIRGGFDVCRNCDHLRGDCASCPDFKGREVREYAKDHYLVKVFEKRKTVVGTAFYQLNHATIRVGIKRFHTVTHFGLCANSKLKGRKVSAVHVCPVCASVGVHSDMVKALQVSKVFISRDIGDGWYMKLFPFPEFDVDGSPHFVDFSPRSASE